MTYEECVQKEILERKPSEPQANLTPMELRAIALRPTPVYNRHTGERVA